MGTSINLLTPGFSRHCWRQRWTSCRAWTCNGMVRSTAPWLSSPEQLALRSLVGVGLDSQEGLQFTRSGELAEGEPMRGEAG